MKDLLFSPETLAMLIAYDPDTGAITWRPRTPEVYMALVPGLEQATAQSRSERFNLIWAQKPVGTDNLGNSETRRVRISLGPGLPALRKAVGPVVWMVATGKPVPPNHEVFNWSGDHDDTRASNLVLTTMQIRRVLESPMAGISQRMSGIWQWIIIRDAVRYRGATEGYATPEEARIARDSALHKLGLATMTKLSDVLNG